MPQPLRTYCASCDRPLRMPDERCAHCAAPRPAAGWPVDPAIGEPLGLYVPQSRLGSGRFGTTYAALGREGDAPRVLRLLHPELAADRELLGRLTGVGHALVALRAGGAVATQEVGQAGAAHFLAQERVGGQSLEALLREGAQPVPLALDLATQLARTIEVASGLGIHHGDLRPGNVRVVRGAFRGDIVKVLDFGLCQILGPHASRLDGGFVARPGYVPPEAIDDPLMASEAGDLYALGVILFQLLTGNRPHGPLGTTREAIRAFLVMTAMEPPPHLPNLGLNLSTGAALDALVGELLAPNPAKRLSPARAVVERITQVARGLRSPLGSVGRAHAGRAPAGLPALVGARTEGRKPTLIGVPAFGPGAATLPEPRAAAEVPRAAAKVPAAAAEVPRAAAEVARAAAPAEPPARRGALPPPIPPDAEPPEAVILGSDDEERGETPAAATPPVAAPPVVFPVDRVPEVVAHEPDPLWGDVPEEWVHATAAALPETVASPRRQTLVRAVSVAGLLALLVVVVVILVVRGGGPTAPTASAPATEPPVEPQPQAAPAPVVPAAPDAQAAPTLAATDIARAPLDAAAAPDTGSGAPADAILPPGEPTAEVPAAPAARVAEPSAGSRPGPPPDRPALRAPPPARLAPPAAPAPPAEPRPIAPALAAPAAAAGPPPGVPASRSGSAGAPPPAAPSAVAAAAPAPPPPASRPRLLGVPDPPRPPPSGAASPAAPAPAPPPPPPPAPAGAAASRAPAPAPPPAPPPAPSAAAAARPAPPAPAAAAAPAGAEDAAAEADRLLRAGQTAYAAGRYAEAIRLLTRGRQLAPARRILFDALIRQAERKQGATP